MRIIFSTRAIFFLILFGLSSLYSGAQPRKLIHFWDFNSTTPLTGVGDAGGNGDSLGNSKHGLPVQYTTLPLSGAKIVYVRPATKQGVATKVDSVLDNDISGSFYYDFSSVNYPYFKTSDSSAAAAACSCNGNLSIRARNPSLNSYLYMYVPTTGYMNVSLSYAASVSSIKGAQYNIFSYSTNGGATWNNLTQAMDTFNIGGIRRPDTLLVLNSVTSTRAWYPVNINFSPDNSANNNNSFIIRFYLAGSNSTTNTGSDRYDNIAIRGDSVCPVLWVQPVNSAICPGSNTSFVTHVAGGLSNLFQWQVNNGGGFTNISNGGVYSGAITDSLALSNVPVSMSGYQYRCIISCPTCNNDTSVAATLSFKPAPVVKANTTTDTICIGNNITLTGSGAISYTWTGGVNNGIAFVPALTNTYTVTGMAADGCTDTASIRIKVNTLPPVKASTTNDSACAGNAVTLTGSGAKTYVWTGGITDGIAFVPAITQTYTVIGKDSNGCVNKDSIKIIVNPLPVISISPSSANICYGNNTSLTASGTNTFLWSPSVGLSCTNCPNPIADPVITTTYTITGISKSGCPDSTTVVINVAPKINASISGKDTICLGTYTTLIASGGNTYLWNTGATSTSVNVSPAIDTIYSIKAIVGGCSDSAKVFVTVNPVPVAVITGNNSICFGNNSLLTASGGSNYVWNTGVSTDTVSVMPLVTTTYSVNVSNGLCTKDTSIIVVVHPIPIVTITRPQAICFNDSIIINASGGNSYLWNTGNTNSDFGVSPMVTTTYTVTVSNGFCSKDTTTVISVNPLPATNIMGNNAICSGDTTLLTGGGGVSYKWNTGSTSTSISVSPNITTTYTLQASNGVCTKNATITVNVTPTPVPDVSAEQSICIGGSAKLSASGATSYTWTPAVGLSSSTISNPFASPGISTTYTVVEANGLCTAKDSIIVIVNPLPVEAASPNTSIVIGQSTPLSVAPQTSGSIYEWSPSSTLSCSNCPDPIASPLVTTTYYLITINGFGCTTEDTVTIDVSDDCGHIFVPNMFSPNGDGHNDELLVFGYCVKEMDFIIYDRWGNKIFESTKQSDGWDGTYKGERMNPGVYAYYLSADLLDGTKINKSGNVALVR